jgi:DNA-3-methyladenine glycosylase
MKRKSPHSSQAISNGEESSKAKISKKQSASSVVLDLNNIKSVDFQDITFNLASYRLKADFFDDTCLSLAKKLLNKYLLRKVEYSPGRFALLAGRIVETEAYLGELDAASHSFGNKQTERTKAMFMKAGTAYVYNIYGVYCCLNVSSREPGAAVLVRALEPVYGLDLMRLARNSPKQDKDLTNGPSKLCQSMRITKDLFNQVDLNVNEDLWLQDELFMDGRFFANADFKVIEAKRIGIDYAGAEAVNQLYRFYIKDNKCVSVRAKEEKEKL